MPKAQSSSQSPRPALRRNQACLPCRKRKLKCDAGRPHCTTCVKQWKTTISVPPPVGFVHPTEPQCAYDPVDGLPLAPDTGPLEKIKALEEQLNQLRNQLRETDPPAGSSTIQSVRSPALPSLFGASSELSPGVIVLPNVSLATTRAGSTPGSSPNNNKSYSIKLSPSPPQELLISGWSSDLPSPAIVNHLIDVFFKCDPCGSRILHQPTFLAAMQLPPYHSTFPHIALLHAICASASRWTSNAATMTPDGTRRDKFAEFHASKTRQYIDRTMASGKDIFQVMQACIVLSWYLYQEGRWVEVWIYAGFQTRVAIPLRLNYPGTFSVHAANGPGEYLPPPRDALEKEIRRRTWWMTILFDRIVSIGGWVHAVDERDIGTELPLTAVDFELQRAVTANPQNISQEDMFVVHPLGYTDSFLLLIKATMLFGRVTDYNVRSNLREPAAITRNQIPFFKPGFAELDKLVSTDFLESFPPAYKHFGLNEDGSIDTDLYLAHILPHATVITLHNSYVDFSDSQSLSALRCVDSARAILTAYYRLYGTSLDITRLHPLVVICWYLAAVVQVQLCRYFIEIGDVSRETTIWGEINVLRSAMMVYGERSPIGTRQEKLLQGLMSEIVRLTSQMEPLEVGVPLYPFSRETAFGKPSPTSAPLPSGSPFENEERSPNLRSSSRAETVNSHSGISVSGAGTSRDLWSTSPSDMSPFLAGVHASGYPRP
ncbi:hypothetical protein BJ322DRAFT_1054850 [Thelephora terrestris]|uniref:Zn(2)-C6 fungal-type domain-containing protein n=1 Tax=Thelephora terrestris TaxID=56493 RepID=A0A9P6HHK5_9AGAM|nr:hypothetical protein BJ322DRAFT_1054850 [Thelephora terrestris]